MFDPVTFDLLRWAADYYHHPIGEVYAAALPASLRKGQPAAISTEHFSLTPQGREELREPSSKRAPQQRALLAWLADRAHATADEVGESFKPELLKSLAARGWIAARRSGVQPGTSIRNADASGRARAHRRAGAGRRYHSRRTVRTSTRTCSMG